jgi:hypothetical protein
MLYYVYYAFSIEQDGDQIKNKHGKCLLNFVVAFNFIKCHFYKEKNIFQI